MGATKVITSSGLTGGVNLHKDFVPTLWVLKNSILERESKEKLKLVSWCSVKISGTWREPEQWQQQSRRRPKGSWKRSRGRDQGCHQTLPLRTKRVTIEVGNPDFVHLRIAHYVSNPEVHLEIPPCTPTPQSPRGGRGRCSAALVGFPCGESAGILSFR